MWDGVVLESEAHESWRRGRKADALRNFENLLSQHVSSFWVVWYVRTLSLELDRLEQAERAFRRMATLPELPGAEPLAHLHLGRIYERTDRPADALEAFESFASAWRGADPELQPLVREAQSAVTRLAGRGTR